MQGILDGCSSFLLKAREFWENLPNLEKLMITLIKNDPHWGISQRRKYLDQQILAVHNIR